MKPIKFSKELAGAIAEEQKRQAIDTAKKKAVAQNADYDTFKKMVSVAHLKPLHAPSSQGSKGCTLPAWQLDPSRLTRSSLSTSRGAAPTAPCKGTLQHSKQQTGTQQQAHLKTATPAAECDVAAGPQKAATAAAVGAAGAPVVPRTSQEFVREWRRNCPTAADKYRLLRQCGPEGLAIIFRVEVDGLLLGQMLQAMQQQWRQHAQQLQQQQQQQNRAASPEQQQHDHLDSSGQPQEGMTSSNLAAVAPAAGADCALHLEAKVALRMLQSLTGAGRFDLSVCLLDKPSKEAAADLCNLLQAVLQQQKHACSAQSSPDPSQATTASSSSSSSSNSGTDQTGAKACVSSSSGHGTSIGSNSIALKNLQAVVLKLRL